MENNITTINSGKQKIELNIDWPATPFTINDLQLKYTQVSKSFLQTKLAKALESKIIQPANLLTENKGKGRPKSFYSKVA